MINVTLKDGKLSVPEFGKKADGSIFCVYTTSPFEDSSTRIAVVTPYGVNDWTSAVCTVDEFEGAVEATKEDWNKEVEAYAENIKKKYTLR